MDNRRAWRILDYSRDVFMHHRKFTPFQKFIFVSLLMGVLFLTVSRNWWGLMLVTNYGLSVYASIKILQLLVSKNVFLPSDRLLQWIENIEGAFSAIFVLPTAKRVTSQSTSVNDNVKAQSGKDKNGEQKNNTQSDVLKSAEIFDILGKSLTKNALTVTDHCSVEREVQRITKLIHKDFFISWYDLFTKDELVWSEAEVILIMIFDSLQGRLLKTNIPHILQSVMILFRTHVRNLKEAEFMFKAQSKRRKSSVKLKESGVNAGGNEIRQRKTLEECYWVKTEMHPALQSVEFELAYQKAIVDCLLLHLLPNELLEIKTLMTVVKEILSVNILKNLMGSISESIFLYERVILITSDEEPLECEENTSGVSVIETNLENEASSVHPILVKRGSGTKVAQSLDKHLESSKKDSTPESDRTKRESSEPESSKSDTKSEEVKWKNDTKIYPVSKSFCCECNRLCSRDREKIPSRPHTCSVGSADEVQRYDRLSIKDSTSDQGSRHSDTSDSYDSRSSPAFILSISDSDSEVFPEKGQTTNTSIPGLKSIPAPDKQDLRGGISTATSNMSGDSTSNDDLSLLNTCNAVAIQGSTTASGSHTLDGEKGTRNFNLPSMPNFFPKFNLNLPNPLSSIQKPLSLGPLKLSPSDLISGNRHIKDEHCLDVRQSQSSGVILRGNRRRSPISPKESTAMNGDAATDVHSPAVFQDIRIINTESAKEPGSTSLYTLYEIQYEALYQSDTKTLVHKTGTVKRRFREFVNLQTRLEETTEYKKCMKDIKGPKKILPSLPFGNMGKETLESRKTLLENFLQALIKKDPISNSEEMKQFLGYSGDGHIAFVRKASETSIPRIDQRLVKTMSGVFDKIVEGLPSLPQQIPRMIPSFESPEDKKDEPEQLEDKDHIDVDVTVDPEETMYECSLDKFMYERMSSKEGNDSNTDISGNTSVDLGVSVLGWQSHHKSSRSPSASPKASHFSKKIGSQSSLSSSVTNLTCQLNDEKGLEGTSNFNGVEDTDREGVCPLSDALLDILTELLRGQDTWMCRDSVMTSTRLVFGKGLNRYLQSKIKLLTSEEMNSFYLKKFREAFWPEDIFSAEGHPPYTDFQREVLTKQAQRCLGEFLPGVLKPLLGVDDFGHVLDEAINSVQYEELNKHIWYSILDILIEEVFPEINSHELQRKLSSAVEKS